MTTYPTRTRRWTRAEYDRLIELGVFQPGDPIELIGGELMIAEPQSAEHYTAICKTAKTLAKAFGPGWTVRTQGPIGLDEESEPEPDVAVVAGTVDDYRHSHPPRPVLTVEISLSSLTIDRDHKGSVYARARLAEYWVLNLIDRALEVYRDPVQDDDAPFGWRYARREIVAPDGHIAPLAAPGASVAVAGLLP